MSALYFSAKSAYCAEVAVPNNFPAKMSPFPSLTTRVFAAWATLPLLLFPPTSNAVDTVAVPLNVFAYTVENLLDAPPMSTVSFPEYAVRLL